MNRNKSIRVAILCLSLAMAGSLPIDAQKVTFHEGSISLKQAFEKLESSSARSEEHTSELQSQR